MKIVDNMRTFIMENEFKLIYLNNKINIVNYESIIHFDNEKVMIKTKDNTITVNGKSLVVSKLMIDELLISGDVSKIEFR